MNSRDRVVAATWLCWRADAVLAVLPRGGDAYYLPGGMPENGETLADAVVREVAEEIGMRLDGTALTEVVRVETDAHGRPGVTVTLACFAGPGNGEPVPDGDEITEVAWLARGDWDRFAPAVRLALERLEVISALDRADSPDDSAVDAVEAGHRTLATEDDEW